MNGMSENHNDVTLAGITATYAGPRSLGSREPLYTVTTEFGTHRIFKDGSTWTTYTPEEPVDDTAPVLAPCRTRQEALEQVARDVLTRREIEGTEEADHQPDVDVYDPAGDGCDNCGGEDHIAEVCPEFTSLGEYEAHVASRRNGDGLCARCVVPEHDTCGNDPSCRCCRDTREGVEEGR